MKINQKWIDEQRAVCEAAIQAPWTVTGVHNHIVDSPGVAVGDMDVRSIVAEAWGCVGLNYLQASKNAAFIAAARTALPAALDALEASMQREAEKDAEIARLKAELAAEKKRADAAVALVEHKCETCKWEGEGEQFCKEPCPHCDPCWEPHWYGGGHVSGKMWEMKEPCAENAPSGAGSETPHA